MAIIHNILIEFGSLGLEILLPSVVICSFEMYESIVDVTIAAKKVNICGHAEIVLRDSP